MTVPLHETRLVRNFPGGARIHLRGCRHAKRVVPWAWAEGRDDDEWLRLGYFKPCKVCLPAQAQRLAEARPAPTSTTTPPASPESAPAPEFSPGGCPGTTQ